MLALGFAGFLIFGVVLVLVGANQGDLARDLDLGLASSGLLMSALALGIGVGVVGAGPLVDRYPRRPLFVAASLLAAAALLLFDPGIGFARAFVQIALLGVAIGVYETLINTAVGERFHEASARPIVLVHAAATLGGMLAPPAIGWIAEHAHWTASFHWTGAAHLALAAAALAIPFPAPPRATAAEPSAHESPVSLALLPFAIVGFAYVGIESATTVLALPYAGAERGRFAISAFWFGLLMGRLLLLAVRGRIDARVLVGAGLAGTLAFCAATFAGVAYAPLVFAACGAALGLVFPVMVALAGDRFPDARGTATGLVVGAAALGGFAIPWLHGAIGDRAGPVVAVASLGVWAFCIAGAARSALKQAST